MGKAFSLTSTRFIVSFSVAVLTISSIVGAMLYLRNIRPTLYGLSGSSGDPVALNRYMLTLGKDLTTANSGPGADKSSVFDTTTPTDVDTEAEEKYDKAFVEADHVILKMKKAYEEPYGTLPGPDVKIEAPKPPTVDTQLQTLEAIPQVIKSAVQITNLEVFTITGGFFGKDYYIKVFNVINLFKKKDLKAKVLLFTNTAAKSNAASKPENFESLEKLKEYISNFPESASKTLYHTMLDQQYELYQSDSTAAAKTFTAYIEKLLKRKPQPSLLCQIRDLIKSDSGTHIAVLLNNRVNTVLESVALESDKRC